MTEVYARALLWGDDQSTRKIQAEFGPFSIVMAADTLYGNEQFRSFSETLFTLVKMNKCMIPEQFYVILAFPVRSGNCFAFIDVIREVNTIDATQTNVLLN